MNFLTKKEELVLKSIKDFFAKNDKMPTVREILEKVNKKGLNIKSLGSIFIYLRSLEEKGFIKRNSEDRGIKFCDQSEKSFFSVPILGTANAGSPTFFAQQNVEGYLKISKKLITRRITESIFAIEVSGTSMNMAEIRGKKIENGDFVLVDADNNDYKSGDKVLATIDGLVTIKTYIPIDQGTIGLFPQSNDTVHKPIYLTPYDNFVINGKVIDVLKTPAMLKIN